MKKVLLLMNYLPCSVGILVQTGGRCGEGAHRSANSGPTMTRMSTLDEVGMSGILRL